MPGDSRAARTMRLLNGLVLANEAQEGALVAAGLAGGGIIGGAERGGRKPDYVHPVRTDRLH